MWIVLIILILILITQEAGDSMKFELTTAKKIIERFSQFVVPIARATGIEPSTVFGIIYTESRGNENATGTSNDIGLMQVTPIALLEVNQKTGSNFTLAELRNPETNIQVGVSYLKICMNSGLNEFDSLRGYNAGYPTAKINPTASVGYANKVIEAKQQFQKLTQYTT